jgi:hypothetical protein
MDNKDANSDCLGWDDNPNARIKSLLYRGGPQFSGGTRGSGAQLAVTALGLVTDFASASVRPNTTPPHELVFANTTPPRTGAPENFGGRYADYHCADDYYGNPKRNKPAANTTITTYRTGNINAGAPTQHLAPGSGSGSVTLTSNTALTGRHVLYVHGDVYINTNLTFAPAYTWNNLNEIPYFYLVVKGNIFIKDTVTQLDGVYIAQPKTMQPAANSYTAGKIYTCTTGTVGSPLFTSAELIATNCKNPLKVFGALIAEQIRFLRVPNTIGQSDPSQAPGQGGTKAPAEEIQFTPELFLIPSPFDDADGQLRTRNQDVTSLPPVF